MDILSAFVIIVLSGGIHATFQLSVSVLTLLSGHSMSQGKSHRNLVKLSGALTLGAIIATALLFCSIAFIIELFYNFELSRIAWAIITGLSIGTALSVWLFYYRRGSKKSGTEIWIPRSFADFLTKRTRKTNHSAEAFSLGVSSVLSEIIFIAAPILAATLASANFTPDWQFVAVAAYVAIANFPLFVIFCLISGGHSLARIQIWRENNKKFLQFSAGLSLLVLAFLIFANIFGVKL